MTITGDRNLQKVIPRVLLMILTFGPKFSSRVRLFKVQEGVKIQYLYWNIVCLENWVLTTLVNNEKALLNKPIDSSQEFQIVPSII